MSAVHTSLVQDAHAYTRVQEPWILTDRESSIYGKLIHYIAGGGMKAFGRTVEQEVVARQQRHFLYWCAVLFAIWCLFYFL